MIERANLSPTIGIALSSGHIRVVSLDEQGTVTSTQSFERQNDKSLSEQIRAVIQDTGGRVVGIAVPGMVEGETSRVIDSRMPELVGVDLRAELRGLSGGNVFIENDVNAAAFAEFLTGAGRGRRNVFCAIFGEGVGSGLILGGEIWRGSHGFAGEFGLVVVDEEGARLEDVASTPNIVRRTLNRLQQDSTSILSRDSEADLTLDEILSAAAEGDDLARLMLERTGFCIGSAIGMVINLLDVGLIVIGGDITRGNGLILNSVVQRAKECASQHSFDATDLVVSELGEDAAAIGAALLARNSQ